MAPVYPGFGIVNTVQMFDGPAPMERNPGADAPQAHAVDIEHCRAVTAESPTPGLTNQDPKGRGRPHSRAAQTIEGNVATTEKLEVVRGSGNVFRDFGDPNAELDQTRAILAAKIIGVLDARELSVRAAESLTGVAASEFSRIRNVKLERFTIDRMITILGKLDQDVELIVKVQPRRKRTRETPTATPRPRQPGSARSAARRRAPA
jgi:predicted XRE-type DNA-binding protein